jgi:hypothetical protein
MGLMPIYQAPNIRKPAKGHKTDPYLLPGCGSRDRSGLVRPTS